MLEELFSLTSDPEERVNMAGSPMVLPSLAKFRNALGAMSKSR